LGDAGQMPFPDASFDVVLISDAWHHFRAQEQVAGEVHRVLKPGGRVVVVEFDPRQLKTRIVAALERMVLEPSTFRAPDRLKDTFAGVGIQGETKAISPTQYVFTGTRQAGSL
jgi:demethylmenaquinone methyltransferase/2-methoxy-6-polyprenyl-1,4-benzoquinol methylase